MFAVFGIFNTQFKVDWLHCADLGVGADFLGNLFDYLVQHSMPGNNKDARCRALGEHVTAYYSANNGGSAEGVSSENLCIREEDKATGTTTYPIQKPLDNTQPQHTVRIELP